jgi:hypothetical protein
MWKKVLDGDEVIEVVGFPVTEPIHRRFERENDLIGAYFAQHGEVPKYQGVA